jgi:hypothetical protein
VAKEPLYPHVTTKSKQVSESKKYEATIRFAWASPEREMAWQEIREYIRRNMRDLATVISVSQELSPKTAADTVALNE